MIEYTYYKTLQEVSIETEKQISDLFSSIIEFDNVKTDIQKSLFVIN
ncbi:hypothetical protein [Xanthomarina sp.]|nr:hypothetical protein [Xanthomarina sp.]